MGKFKEYDRYDGLGMAELVGKKDLSAQHSSSSRVYKGRGKNGSDS